jgi:hypothetical protein
MPEMHLSGVSIVERDHQKQEEDKNRIREQKQLRQLQQVGNSPDNDNNNNDNNSKNTSSSDDDNRNDRISFSEEISYMFDDAYVWIHAESVENDDDNIPEVNEDEENIYNTLSSPISHDMSYMNSSFLAVSHVSELLSSSVKLTDKEQSDTNEFSPRRVMENQAKKKLQNALDNTSSVSEGKDKEGICDEISNNNSSEVSCIRSELSEDTVRK